MSKATVNMDELVKRLVEGTERTKKDTRKVVEDMIEVIKAALAVGENVDLRGFVKFAVKETKARTGVNPQTKEPIEIPAGKRVAVTAGSKLKDAVKS